MLTVVTLRHAKVVVVDGIHGRKQCHAFVQISHRFVGFSFPEKNL